MGAFTGKGLTFPRDSVDVQGKCFHESSPLLAWRSRQRRSVQQLESRWQGPATTALDARLTASVNRWPPPPVSNLLLGTRHPGVYSRVLAVARGGAWAVWARPGQGHQTSHQAATSSECSSRAGTVLRASTPPPTCPPCCCFPILGNISVSGLQPGRPGPSPGSPSLPFSATKSR